MDGAGAVTTTEFDAVSAPISAEAPAGFDPRSSADGRELYFEIKDARAVARSAERQAQGSDPSARPDPAWRTIAKKAPELLTRSAKDLEVAAWYLEALVRLEGFRGLARGLRIIQIVLDVYWDTFHSSGEPDDLGERLDPVTALNGLGEGGRGEGKLLRPICEVPLVPASQGAFTFYDYQLARSATRSATPADAEKATAGFRQSLAAGGEAFVNGLIRDLEDCIAELAGLQRLLDEKAGRAAPSTGRIEELLREILDVVRQESRGVLTRARAIAASTSVEPAAPAAGEDSSTGAPQMPVGTAANREQALEALARIADWFRTAEPQSPISASLDEIIRRSRLSFQELIAELTTDPQALKTVLNNAGIRVPPTGQAAKTG